MDVGFIVIGSKPIAPIEYGTLKQSKYIQINKQGISQKANKLANYTCRRAETRLDNIYSFIFTIYLYYIVVITSDATRYVAN